MYYRWDYPTFTRLFQLFNYVKNYRDYGCPFVAKFNHCYFRFNLIFLFNAIFLFYSVQYPLPTQAKLLYWFNAIFFVFVQGKLFCKLNPIAFFYAINVFFYLMQSFLLRKCKLLLCCYCD